MNLVDSLKTILEVLNVKIDRKADQSEVNLKATKSEMKSALSLKADTAKMTKELDKKASKTEVNTGLSEKLDITEAENTYGLKYAEQAESITDGSFVVIKEDYTKLFLKTDSTISGKPLDYIGCIYDYSNITLEPDSNYFFIIDNKTIISGEKQSEMTFSLCMNDFDHYKSNIIYKEDEIIVYGDTSIIDGEVGSPYWTSNLCELFLQSEEKNITYKKGWNGLINLLDIKANEVILPEQVDNEKFQINCISGDIKKLVFPKNLTTVTTCGNYRILHVDEVVFPEVPFTINGGFKRSFSSNDGNFKEGATYIPSNATIVGENTFTGYEALNYTGDLTNAPWGAYVAGYCEDGFVYTSEEKTELIGVYGDQYRYDVPSTVTTISRELKNIYRQNKRGRYGVINVPNTVTSIANTAFRGFQVVNYSGTATFGQYESYINPTEENGIFYSNSNKEIIVSVDPDLEEITIPNSVTRIVGQAFCNSKIETLIIPDGVQCDSYCFRGMQNLKSLSIGNCSGNFYEGISRQSLEEIIVRPSTSRYVVQEGLNALIDANNGYKLLLGCKNTTDIPSGTLDIYGSAFAGTDIEELVLPDTITSLGDTAFRDCKKLKRITLSSNLQNLGSHTFTDCPLLEEVTIPSSVTNIYIGTFSRCYNLNLIIPSDFSGTVSSYALYEIKNLTYNGSLDTSTWMAPRINQTVDTDGAVYSDSTKTVLTYAPYVEEYIIPSTIASIARGAFEHNPITKKIDCSNYTGMDNNYLFAYCSNLEEIILPEGLETIPEGFCSNCYNLKYIKIPDSVTQINSYAFSNCYSLSKNFNLNNVERCGTNFHGCSLFNIDAPKLTSAYPNYTIESVNVNCPEDAYCDSLLKNGVRTSFNPRFDLL